MYSFFQDPRNGNNARRRQDRQDFFPSFSDSLFFDPFLGGHNNGLSEADDPTSPSKQRQQRQRQWLREQQQQQYQRELEEQQYEQERQRLQEQYELERQQQLLQEQQLAQEEMRHRAATEGRMLGRQQQRQHPQRPKDRHELSEGSQAFDRDQRQHPQYHTSQQRPQHQPQSHQNQQWRGGLQDHGSKRRGRRQRKRGAREPDADEIASDQVDVAEDTRSADATSEYEDTAEAHPLPSFKAQPTRKASLSTVSDEPEEAEELDEPEEQDDDEDDETAASEEEDPLPCDKELQQKSQAELQQIDTSLGELSHELDEILAGQISNRKQILMTEENLTKAMLKIDAVESGGDDGIRKKRKELINRAEQLLAKVDEFKRRTKTSAFSPNH
ncbi:MAG: hypothetical protein J3Q66DRAFT_351127 [Benniella sp.]|nr:MAG: hypothetical protein J3Q66DRAFT_351127 [Benniella sp.]